MQARLDFDRPRREEIPWDLLLDADPSRARIEEYLDLAWTRVARRNGAIVGVYVLAPEGDTVFELMNIAVREDLRGTGLGRQLLTHAIALAESNGARVVEVGTGNSSFAELAFYQRAGFRIVGVRTDFFADYPEPIVENGIACLDMVRLRLTLTPE